MSNIDTNLLTKYMNMPYTTPHENSKLTNFPSIGPVWQWTNEPLADYYNRNLQGKKVLSVTGGGDHILHATLGGATDITGFDINIFSKYFSSLKIAMIKKLSFEEFIKNRYILSQDGICNIQKLSDVIKTLNNNEQDFFNILISKFDECKDDKKLTERLGMHLLVEYSMGNTKKYAYYNPESYLRLQENLLSCDIKYIDSSLEDICENKHDKYDIIYASNILGRAKDQEKSVELANNLSNILLPNGVLYDYALDDEEGLDVYLESVGRCIDD